MLTKIIMTVHNLLGRVSLLVNYTVLFFVLLIAFLFKLIEYIQIGIILLICFIVWLYAKVEDIRLTIFGMLFAKIVINDMLKTNK
jgi:hypothetical protein